MSSPPPPPRRPPGILHRVVEETGLLSLSSAPFDVKLLCLQRFARMFAYGLSTLVLVAYLSALAVPKTDIGLFMTLTLAGDVCLSFALTLFADALGRRAVLALGAALVTASGLAFALSGQFWVLLAAAVVGVISPSGNEIGPFRAIEESIVAQLTDARKRSDVYAWYSLVGLAGAACGCMACGWVLQHLTGTLGWGSVRAYRAIYVGYALLGLVKLGLTMLLSRAVESENKDKNKKKKSTAQDRTTREGEARPLLENEATELVNEPPKRGFRALLPDISKESMPVVMTLCFLFALDSFGSGLAPLSWITYYFKSQFDIEEGELGSIFFATQIIAGASMLVASSLAKRFGNVNTMIFTHLPSQIFRALLGVPRSPRLALIFLVLNASTQSMDTGPRSAFLAAAVLPAERTAVMGTVNVVRTTAQSLGPLLTGILVDRGLFWVTFVASGGVKIVYDLGLLAFFKNKERERERAERLRARRDEETVS
ncbi:MFS general substrate transporter [Daldinia caldariorum]|uniref:MFS general substrate transporter n=1 Tax=Daldinia caldariorum TaxID=326644 RepID=UPI002008C19B|nr:MFS general substrate transporter [Daldinia caldariorum]KAI1472872.1 MFS general substrate transporter [Daldinia caldariorum]